MKRFKLVAVIAAMAIFAMMAIGSGSTSEGDKKDIISADSEENAESLEKDAAEEIDSAEAITIEEQVLFEQDGLKVTATEYVTDSIWGDGIKLLIENEGSTDLGLGCTALIVNDYMISDLFSTTVAAGKKDYETLNLSSSELKAAGIENVGQIEVYFRIFEADSYKTVSNVDCVTVKTSEYDSMDNIPNDSGQELYNDGGIRIVGKYVDESSFWGAAVLLYVENNSGKNVIIHCDDMSINGFMVSPIFSSTVYDGKKAIDDITLLSSELEENNISSVDDIELKFKIMGEDYSNIVETDAISFSAK